MREERRHGVLEHAFVEQVDLPAATLLRRRTHKLDAGLEIVRTGGGCEERPDDRHRNEVVTAAVSDVGKGVVLGEKRDRGPRRADPRAECGRETAEIPLDLVAILFEQRGDAADRALLLVRELRVGVDLPRELDQVAAERVIHAAILSRSALSVAIRTAVDPSASAVIIALWCARSLMLASRISTECPGTGFSLTGKRTQSVGTLVETLPRSLDAVTRTPRTGVTPRRSSSAAMTSPTARFAFTGS